MFACRNSIQHRARRALPPFACAHYGSALAFGIAAGVAHAVDATACLPSVVI